MAKTVSFEFNPLNKLIEDIYDAATDYSLWPKFLHNMVSELDAESGIFWIQNITSDKRLYCFNHGIDDSRKTGGEKHLLVGDSIFQAARDLSSRQWLQNTDLEQAQFSNLKYFLDCLHPQKIEYAATGFMNISGPWAAMLSLNKKKTMNDFSAAEMKMLGHLSPHLEKALQVSHHLFESRIKLDGLQTVLNQFSAAIALFDCSGEMIFANFTAASMSLNSNGISFKNNKLTTLAKKDFAKLNKLIQQSVKSNTPVGGLHVIKHPGLYKKQLITVAPIKAEFQLDANDLPSLVSAAVVVSSPNDELNFPPDMLASLYDFTPAENNLSIALANGQDLETIAVESGVSKNTMRNHLKACFKKTGAKRQAELVKLVLAGKPVIGLDWQRENILL